MKQYIKPRNPHNLFVIFWNTTWVSFTSAIINEEKTVFMHLWISLHSQISYLETKHKLDCSLPFCFMSSIIRMLENRPGTTPKTIPASGSRIKYHNYFFLLYKISLWIENVIHLSLSMHNDYYNELLHVPTLGKDKQGRIADPSMSSQW